MCAHFVRSLSGVGVLAVAASSFYLSGCGGSSNEPVTSDTKKYQVVEAGDTESAEQPAATGGGAAAGSTAGGPGNATAGPGATPGGSLPGGSSSPAVGGPPPSLAAEQLNSYEVPDGDPQDLQQFIQAVDQSLNDLVRTRATSREQQELIRDRVRQALLAKEQAADRLFNRSKDSEAQIRAAEAKFSALMNLAFMGEPGVTDRIQAFSKTILASDDPELVRQGRQLVVALDAGRMASGQPVDFDRFLSLYEQAVQDPNADETMVQITQEAVAALNGTGKVEQAQKVIDLAAAAFLKHSNPEIRRVGMNLDHQLQIQRMDFQEKMSAVLADGSEQATDEFLAAARKVLELPEAGEAVLFNVSQVLGPLEYSGRFKACRELCQLIQEKYGQHAQENLRQYAEAETKPHLDRLDLIGKPLAIDGMVTADGKPFDWSQFRGKLVLVDFWATWCGPCREEFPNMKENYEKYKAMGFEIVGVNLDQQRSDVDAFFASSPLPWTTVFSVDPEKNALAEACHVEAIPFTLLVNAEGTVVDMHLLGDRLDQRLAELLAPAEPTSWRSESPAAALTAWYLVSAENPEWAEAAIQETRRGNVEQEPAGQEPAGGDSVAAEDQQLPELPEGTRNPYSAPQGLDTLGLVDYLLTMLDKPLAIQDREGFAEAVVEAADRVLASDAKDRYQVTAAQAKFDVLHRQASFGNRQADEQLLAFARQRLQDPRPEIAERAAFFVLERRVYEADKLQEAEILPLLDEVEKYLEQAGELGNQHLRLASNTVRAINQLSDNETREKQFDRFGQRFAKSSDKELARYGKKLAQGSSSAGGDLIGQPLELTGTTGLGLPFDWGAYRGKVVLVDFWATWCGPCRREMPHVKALYERLKDQGLDVVAVSLDRDLDAVSKYLQENSIAWTNLIGEETQELARKYQVLAIPTMMVVDKEGKIVATAHQVEPLVAKIEALLK